MTDPVSPRALRQSSNFIFVLSPHRADQRRSFARQDPRARLLLGAGGGPDHQGDRVGTGLPAQEGDRPPRSEAGEHSLRVNGEAVPDQDLRLRPGLGHQVHHGAVLVVGHPALANAGKRPTHFQPERPRDSGQQTVSKENAFAVSHGPASAQLVKTKILLI